MEHPVKRIRSELTPDDQVRLADIMARHSLSDDDAVLLVIAECLLIMCGMRNVRDQMKQMTERAAQSSQQCVSAAQTSKSAAELVRHLLGDPQTAQHAVKTITEANVAVAVEIERLKERLAVT